MSGGAVGTVFEGAPSGREERVIAHLRGPRAGPLVVVVGGIHGNETAGVRAAERIAARLEPFEDELAGEVLLVRANLQALRAGVRFRVIDMNRCWNDERVSRVRVGDARCVEEREMQGLLGAIDPWVVGERDVVIVDLHSTSAGGAPFLVLSDAPACQDLVSDLPLPQVLGLDRVVDGALASWCCRRGHSAVVCEGGEHGDPDAVAHHEALVLAILGRRGVLPDGLAADADQACEQIARRCEGLPRRMRVVHRQHRTDGDGFRMARRFDQFHRVRKGELLARNDEGELRAPQDGILMLPSYQEQGDDGYYLGVEVSASPGSARSKS